MKKRLVLAVSVLSLLGICFAIFYQVANLKLLDRRGLRQKHGGTVAIEEEETPLSDDFDDEDLGDGYVRDGTDYNAPKEIQSSDITSFFCAFSTLYEDETLTMGNKRYALKADLDGDVVKGSFAAWDYDDSDERRFEADKSFMKELQEIIKNNNIVQYNGLDSEIKGIPDDYGATISVVYESGENIYAMDNSDNFLPPDAEDLLVQLFAGACAKGNEVIGVSVTEHFEAMNVPDGSGFIKFPILTIGRNDVFGETDDLKYPAEDALRDTIDAVNSKEADEARSSAGSFGKGSFDRGLYYDADCFVTRNDTEVVSFYVRACDYEDMEQSGENTFVRTYNIEAENGKILTFKDTFKNLKNLPGIIVSLLKKEYPKLDFNDNAEESISESIDDNDGDVCFALGNGFVHIFINEYVVNDRAGAYHLTLAVSDYPGLISNFYVTCPDNSLTRLDYNTDYFIKKDKSFRMECYEAPGEEDVYWKGIVGDNTYEATYYGHAPEAYLARKNKKNYLYLNLPTGDVSFHGIIYEIKDDGIEPVPEQGDMSMTIADNTTLDPDYFLMNINNVIDGTVCFMYPTGAFKIDDDGFPVSVANEYKLSGSRVKIKESGRYNPRNIEDAANSGGMFYVTEDTEVTPYASDLKSYIDFITTDEEESRILRFTIDSFSSDMKLDNFGKLEDVFKE
ncbi:hypothetical protein [Butyrivibrio sp. AE3004]|uniref:hypothetical protein n=1 Tax=Butyrivibrio sp. AE3004 TaxID=1506994 RepID=UPI000494D1AD|nr:hypothetical protein [Butyrivibrio sp. AE3004]